ncbi:hypothetical protein ACU4GD_38075 [Cupriavidus basilensis]
MVQTEEIPPARRDAIDPEVDRSGIARYERLREHAGLFAHADSHCLLETWTEQQRHQAVALAIQRMPGTVLRGRASQPGCPLRPRSRPMALRAHRLPSSTSRIARQMPERLASGRLSSFQTAETCLRIG